MAAKVKVLSAGAVKPGVGPVVAAFQRDTGYEIAIEFATAPAIRQRLNGGEAPDVVIAPPDLLDQLAKSGRTAAERVTVGRIGVGVMVRNGAPVPKIASVDEVIQALLHAKSIVYNQASTGMYLDKLFDRLGVAAQVKTKSTRCADFAAVLDHVSKSIGQEIGFGATSVIIENAGKGVQYVGPLPAEIQNYTNYAATVVAHGEVNDAARALVDYLATPAARSIFAAAGIE
ncbi:MAG TPA: substrate-binding domain-containing protein [Candidatus Limnocylindrales bacterium]|nr:substrate-binding domain-containing protein [Candidatus Limnocylindrales bacterium]